MYEVDWACQQSHTHFTSTVFDLPPLLFQLNLHSSIVLDKFKLGLGSKKFGVSKSAVKRHIDHSKSPGTWHVDGNKFMVYKVSASCFAQSAEMSLVFLAALLCLVATSSKKQCCNTNWNHPGIALACRLKINGHQSLTMCAKLLQQNHCQNQSSAKDVGCEAACFEEVCSRYICVKQGGSKWSTAECMAQWLLNIVGREKLKNKSAEDRVLTHAMAKSCGSILQRSNAQAPARLHAPEPSLDKGPLFPPVFVAGKHSWVKSLKIARSQALSSPAWWGMLAEKGRIAFRQNERTWICRVNTYSDRKVQQDVWNMRGNRIGYSL